MIGIGNSINKFFANVLGDVFGKPASESLGMLVDDKNYLGNYFTKATGAGLTDAEKEANAFTAQREDIAWNRQLEAANTANQREVMDLQAAGLNPMLAAQGNGSSVPSASAQGSVSPSGGDLSAVLSAVTGMRAQNLNKAIAMRDLDIKQNVADAQIHNINADTALKKQQENESRERERGARIINDVGEATKYLKIEAVEIANNISRATEAKIYAEVDGIASQIRLNAAKADTEVSKQALNYAAARLDDMRATEIAEMLPYAKALSEAQTTEAKAAATLSFAKAAAEKKMLDGGYYDNVIKQSAAELGMTLSEEHIKTYKEAVYTGDFSKVNELEGNKPTFFLKASQTMYTVMYRISNDLMHFSASASVRGSTTTVNRN